MLLRELFFREASAPVVDIRKYGRAFNHPEHLAFFVGSDGILEALNHFKEIASEKAGKTTVRKKWDGNPQVYWGRETKGGPLILAGHNQWSRGVKGTSPAEVYDFIANQSGNTKTPEQAKERQQFATNFANLYPIFDAATPKTFVGFVYADAMFGVDPGRPKRLDPPTEEYTQGVWSFHPNPKSRTVYHVAADSELGQRITNAQVMVVGHGFFAADEFGADDRDQQPMDDFSQFDSTPALIVHGALYTEAAPAVDLKPVDTMIKYVEQHGAVIDSFIGSLPDPDKNGILYPFFNAMSNLHAGGKQDFNSINGKTFIDWMTTKGVSKNKQQHIINMIQEHPGGLDAIFHLVKGIRTMKDQMHGATMYRKEIWDTDGEGSVRYAQKNHKYGNVKFVPTSYAPGALTA